MKDFDKDGDGELSREEFANLIQNIDRTRRGLPPTAQVAKQQGLYLAASLNAEAHGKPKVRIPLRLFRRDTQCLRASAGIPLSACALTSLLSLAK